LASIKPIPEEPAAIVGESLVVTDLHIGVETSYRDRGVMIPSQIKKLTERLKNPIQQTDVNKLIVLGDLKHNVHGSSWQEQKEIPKFLNKLTNHVSISIIPGNHDGNLKKIIPKNKKIKLLNNRGTIVDEVGLVHGHTWPKPEIMQCKNILIGHNHPVIEFNDGFKKHRKKAWIRTPLNKNNLNKKYPNINWKNQKLVIMPAYSNLVGSVSFNNTKNNFLGPLFNQNIANTNKMTTHLLDGTYLGKVKKIKNNQK